MRIEIALSELKPNPFKADILNGKLSEDKICRLQESIRQTGFWDNVVCRKVGDEYQLGYGHKRVEAAKRELGKDHVISIPVMVLTDEQMIQMMAMENATGEVEELEAQMDVVKLAQEWLKKHPEACVCGSTLSRRPEGHAHEQHQVGSTTCISRFLGTKNWNHDKINHLLHMSRDLDPEIKRELKDAYSDRSGYRTGPVVGIKAGAAIASLPPKTQRPVYDMVKNAPAGSIYAKDIQRIAKVVKKSTTEKKHDTAIRMTKELTNPVVLPKNLPDINGFVISVGADISRILNGDQTSKKLNALVQYRQHVNSTKKATLCDCLEKLAKRAVKYAVQLQQVTPKQLKTSN